MTLSTSYPTLAANSLVGLRYCFELFFGGFLDVFSEGCHLVRMVFDGLLSICLFHLVVGCIRCDFQNLIVAVVAWTELGEDSVDFGL